MRGLAAGGEKRVAAVPYGLPARMVNSRVVASNSASTLALVSGFPRNVAVRRGHLLFARKTALKYSVDAARLTYAHVGAADSMR